MPNKKTIKVRTFLNALIKNGYPWTQGHFQNSAGESCAIGQAMRNLGYDLTDPNHLNTAWSLADSLNALLAAGGGDDDFDDTLISFNDHRAISYDEVIEWAKKNFGPLSENKITYVEYTSEV